MEVQYENLPRPSRAMSNRPQEIVVRNWDKFQHYKKRNPPWIRLYRDVIDSPEWRSLSDPAARLLVEIWLLASELAPGGRVPFDLGLLAWRTGRASTDASIGPALQELASQGFIVMPDDASTIASTIASKDPRQSTETETDTSPPNGGSEPSGSVLGSHELVAKWIDRIGSRPPSSIVSRNGEAARKICTEATREDVERAWAGMEKLFEYRDGQPWDLMDFERKFAKALQASNGIPKKGKPSDPSYMDDETFERMYG